MKVREIITLKGWVNGSGWSYTTCYGDEIIDISAGTPDEIKDMGIDWSWWDAGEAHDGGDTEITVRYYDVDADPDEDAPIGEWSTWESDLTDDEGDEGDEV